MDDGQQTAGRPALGCHWRLPGADATASSSSARQIETAIGFGFGTSIVLPRLT
jgi:hypothetical protein